MKRIYLVLVMTASVFAGYAETIKGEISANRTIKATDDILMDGLVWVTNNATLTIEPGAVIRFKATPSTSDNTSALFITRGAKIIANGTVDKPIIFTAEDDDLSPNALLPTDIGKWGGLVLLGKAPVMKKGATELVVEGIPSTETRGMFGGTDAADNSGSLKYVSIRYTGVGFQPGDELQGLTLGGVGSGTTIDYIDVYVSGDDGVECFGGTVNLTHFSVAYATDDCFDFDLGYSGKCQFLFSVQRTADYDNSGEWDGASPDDEVLYSKPLFYNATLIGPGTNATGTKRAIMMRENFAGTIANSVLSDYPGKGLQVQDMTAGIEDCYSKMMKGELKVLNNTWANFNGMSKIGTGTDGIIEVTSKDANSNPVTPDHADCAELIKHMSDNKNMIQTASAVKKVTRNTDGEIDAIDPRTTSLMGDLATYPSGMTSVTYRGAFEPGKKTWLDGWSTLAKYGKLATVGIEQEVVATSFSVYPNPSNGSFNISLGVENIGQLSVEIYDLTGKLIATPVNGSFNGSVINVNESLISGTYIVKVTTSDYTSVQQVVVQ